MNFTNFTVTDIQGHDVDLSRYEGYTVLVVNTATKCGFANQFEGLEKLYQDFKDKKFMVLGFPCNQFNHQEPGDNEAIKSTCTLNFGVTFPLFSKVDVFGANQEPLYAWLTSQKKTLLGKRIQWNFTKFLINSQGEVIKRFNPTVKPNKMRPMIEKLLT